MGGSFFFLHWGPRMSGPALLMRFILVSICKAYYSEEMLVDCSLKNNRNNTRSLILVPQTERKHIRSNGRRCSVVASSPWGIAVPYTPQSIPDFSNTGANLVFSQRYQML